MARFFASDSEAQASWAPWLAGCLPLAYYVAGASGYCGLGEEGSFISAARQFDVAYPPGAPISALLAAPFALLPIGPLSFRIGVANALFAALALGLFARALLFTLAHVGVKNTRLAGVLSVCASLWLGQTALFAQQAMRPQVFSVQFALSMLVFDALLRFEAGEPHGSTRTLYFGAFVQGLCFANHHVYGLLMLPVAAPTLGRVFAYRGFIGLMGHVAAPMLGFSAYVYVPSRLASTAHGTITEQTGLTRVATMLGAEPYWGPPWATPLPALKTLREGLLGSDSGLLLLATLALCALGFAAMLQSSSRRRFGLVWLIALLVPLTSVSFMLEPRLQEDAWGALMPCAFALVASATCAAGILLTWLFSVAPRISQLLPVALLVLGVLGFVRSAPRASAHAVPVYDALDDLTRRTLPSRAVLFHYDAANTFRYLGGEAEEGGLRADVTLIPLAFREFPHLIDDWASADPELAESLRQLVLEGRLNAASLHALSAVRPVYVDFSEQLSATLYETSVDEGLLVRALADGVPQTDEGAAKALQAARLRRLYRPAGELVRLPQSAALQLGHTHLLQALQRVSLGDREGARDYLELARTLGYVDPRLARLEQALLREAPIDIASYLRQGS